MFHFGAHELNQMNFGAMLKRNLLLSLLCLIMTYENVSHWSGSFVLVAPFSVGQAGQSSSQKAHQAQSRPTFPDGNALPGTFERVSFVIWENNFISVYIYLSLSKTPKIWYRSEWMKYVVLVTADMLILWISLSSVIIIVVGVLSNSLNKMIQRAANENAAGIFLRDSLLFVRSLLIATTTWFCVFFLLSFVKRCVTRFACDIGQSAKFWIWVSSEVITICI